MVFFLMYLQKFAQLPENTFLACDTFNCNFMHSNFSDTTSNCNYILFAKLPSQETAKGPFRRLVKLPPVVHCSSVVILFFSYLIRLVMICGSTNKIALKLLHQIIFFYMIILNLCIRDLLLHLNIHSQIMTMVPVVSS